MKLSKKTLVYSCILAVTMVIFIVGYFTLMLPALYVSYEDENNYKEILSVHKRYMKKGSYENIKTKYSINTCTLEIPKNPTNIMIKNSYIDMTINIEDNEIYDIFCEIYKKIDNWEGNLSGTEADHSFGEDEFEQYLKKIKEKLSVEKIIPEDYPVKINLVIGSDMTWKDESMKILSASETRTAIETSVTDGKNYYTAYFIIERCEEKLVISLMSVITPKMEEIRPIVFQSLPMIIAVIFFIVLISSQFFSKKIVNPIVRLASTAMNINFKHYANSFLEQEYTKKHKEDEDEISQLRQVLADLYEKLYESYAMLEEKNKALEMENERQQVFLRASSHQLKTPVAAALLLVDGMIDEVGKYKDTKENLPKVKAQILSMKKIVEEILYLNHSTDNLTFQELSLNDIVNQVIHSYQVQMNEKNLQVKIQNNEKFSINSSEEMIEKIIDNIISNAVKNSAENSEIDIIYDNENRMFVIKNYGAIIPEELLPHIFEPFVSSDTKQKGKGLGLYIVQWYSRLLEVDVEIGNLDNANGVEVKLVFHKVK